MSTGSLETDAVRRTDNDTINGHVLARNLEPSTRGSAKIDTTFCRLEEVVLLVQLDELEGRTRTVPLLSAHRTYCQYRGV